MRFKTSLSEYFAVIESTGPFHRIHKFADLSKAEEFFCKKLSLSGKNSTRFTLTKIELLKSNGHNDAKEAKDE